MRIAAIAGSVLLLSVIPAGMDPATLLPSTPGGYDGGEESECAHSLSLSRVRQTLVNVRGDAGRGRYDLSPEISCMRRVGARD
jgi:hypothetical protein